MLRLDTEVQYVKGVGPRRSALLASRGIRTVGDLLLHIPKTYQDRAHFVGLDALIAGQDAAVHARVYLSRVIQTRTRGRILDVILTDGVGFAHAKWFHGGYLQQSKMFNAGRALVLYGRVDFDSRESKFVFFNPEFELLDENETGALSLDVGCMVSIYEEIGGLTSRQLRRIFHWTTRFQLQFERRTVFQTSGDAFSKFIFPSPATILTTSIAANRRAIDG